jgi:hypothetical protein
LPRCRAGQERGPGRVGPRVTQEEVDETQQGTQPLPVHESHQISLSEQGTWKEVGGRRRRRRRQEGAASLGFSRRTPQVVVNSQMISVGVQQPRK